MFRSSKNLLIVAPMALVAACDGDDHDPMVSDLAAGDARLSILGEAIEAAGLTATFRSPGNYTVFAPTDDAFAALLTELGLSKSELLANKTLLTEVLTYHALNGRVLTAAVPAGMPITTLQGETFTVDAALAITFRRGRKPNITATDVFASNGVIHVIDKVLLPAP